MSKGLGREQRAILAAVAADPEKRWRRMAIQQAVWGAQLRNGHLTRSPEHGRPYRNVAWWRTDQDGARRQNYDSTFGRAIRGLERRGLIERRQEPGCRPSWELTATGAAEAAKLGLASWA